ncbi:MAG: hypothetical protein ABDH61_03055 [Acidilobaceae archaeon]
MKEEDLGMGCKLRKYYIIKYAQESIPVGELKRKYPSYLNVLAKSSVREGGEGLQQVQAEGGQASL